MRPALEGPGHRVTGPVVSSSPRRGRLYTAVAVASFVVLANPADEVSLLRVLNTPPRGIGTGTVEALLTEAVSQGKPLWAVLMLQYWLENWT